MPTENLSAHVAQSAASLSEELHSDTRPNGEYYTIILHKGLFISCFYLYLIRQHVPFTDVVDKYIRKRFWQCRIDFRDCDHIFFLCLDAFLRRLLLLWLIFLWNLTVNSKPQQVTVQCNWSMTVFSRMVLKGGRSGKSWSSSSGCCYSVTTKQWKVRCC